MAVIDETGNRYDRLLVLKRAENNYRGEAQWLCRCDCGNETIVSGVSLRSNHTRSCGCLQKDAVRQTGYNNTIDLSGQRFGKLTVVERIPGSRDKGGKWKCKCDCGNYCATSTYNLTTGHTKSCGCLVSTGELIITKYLTNNNYIFSKEYTFSDLKRKTYLRFDFAIFDENNQLKLLIEYDGPQHTIKTDGFYSERLVENDMIKTDYCIRHNIPLYRINYDENIEEKLEEILNRKENYVP